MPVSAINAQDTFHSPAVDAFEVTPAPVPFEFTTKGVYVGGTGNVVVEMESGAQVTFIAVPGGTVLPIRAAKILPSSTATNMVALQ